MFDDEKDKEVTASGGTVRRQLVFPSQVHSQLCFSVFHMFAPELRNRRLPAAFTVLLCCKHTFISTGGLHHLEDHATILHRTLLIMLHSEVK